MESEAVIGAGVTLTASTPIIDVSGTDFVDAVRPVFMKITSDGLDPASGLNWWNLGYLYAPNHVPDGSTSGIRPYVRHGKGGNYAWAGGNVSLASWKTMSTGLNGQVNWFYMASPNDPPTVP